MPAQPRKMKLQKHRGFRELAGTHAVGSGSWPEPTPWVPCAPEPTPWVPGGDRNPRRGFRELAGTHAVGSVGVTEPTPWVRGPSGRRSSVCGVLRVSGVSMAGLLDGPSSNFS